MDATVADRTWLSALWDAFLLNKMWWRALSSLHPSQLSARWCPILYSSCPSLLFSSPAHQTSWVRDWFGKLSLCAAHFNILVDKMAKKDKYFTDSRIAEVCLDMKYKWQLTASIIMSQLKSVDLNPFRQNNVLMTFGVTGRRGNIALIFPAHHMHLLYFRSEKILFFLRTYCTVFFLFAEHKSGRQQETKPDKKWKGKICYDCFPKVLVKLGVKDVVISHWGCITHTPDCFTAYCRWHAIVLKGRLKAKWK